MGSHHCLRFFKPVNNNYLFDRPIHSLHQLQQAAITKPSSNCQRSIYPENSNGHLDFSSKTATSSFICCELFLTEHTKQLSADSFHPLFYQTKSKLLQMCSHHAIYTTLFRHFCKLSSYNNFHLAHFVENHLLVLQDIFNHLPSLRIFCCRQNA